MKIFDDTSPTITEMASAFSALGSEQRISVLRSLVRAGEDGLSIGALGARTGVTGSTLTHHVKQLALAGLVDQVKHGRVIQCAVNYDRIRELSSFLLAECCTDPAQHLDEDHD